MKLKYEDFKKLTVRQRAEAFSDFVIAVAGAVFTLIEWSFVVGAVTYLANESDDVVLHLTANVLLMLVVLTVYCYLTWKTEFLLWPKEQLTVVWKWGVTIVVNVILILGLFNGLSWLIGRLVRAASEKL